MEELSNNMSQIIIGKKIVEDELKLLKMAYMKNENELADVEEQLEFFQNIKQKIFNLIKSFVTETMKLQKRKKQ